MKIRSWVVVFCCGATLTGMTNVANAEKYLSLFGAYTDLKDTDFQVAPGTISTEFDEGWGFGAAFGTRLGQVGEKNRWRLEGEFSLRSNDVEAHKLNGGAALAGSTGEMKSSAFMVNALIDFNEAAKFTPYIGAGVGLAKVDASGFGVSAIPTVLDDDSTVFAYQAILGAGWEVSERAELFLEYRYFATDDVSVTTSGSTGMVNTDLSYETNNVLFGARFSL